MVFQLIVNCYVHLIINGFTTEDRGKGEAVSVNDPPLFQGLSHIFMFTCEIRAETTFVKGLSSGNHVTSSSS